MPQKYRRLHVIVGDANLSEVATFLKVGTTALVLSMIEDDWLTRDLLPARPVQALRHVSYDLTLARPIDLADGTSITALDAQWELHGRARKFADERGLECVGGEEVGEEVLRRWEAVLTALETDPGLVADQVDWVAKHRVIDGYRARHDLRWDDARLAAMDLQYHDLRPSKSLAARVGPGAHRRRRRDRAGRHRAAARHPGLLPGALPAALAREHRGRQLGLSRVRRRWGSAATGADDGTVAWNQGPCG